MKDCTPKLGITIVPPKGMTMGDLQQLADRYGCIAKQTQPGVIDMSIKKSSLIRIAPVNGRMMANVPQASSTRFDAANE